MDYETYYDFNKQKANLQVGLGCFFGLVILGLLTVALPIWFIMSYSSTSDIELDLSHSPNNINTIEVLGVNEFPHQITTTIKYNDHTITKTYRPDKISIEWHNDYKVDVIFIRQFNEKDITTV